MRGRFIIAAVLILAGLVWLGSRLGNWGGSDQADPGAGAVSLTETNPAGQSSTSSDPMTASSSGAPSNSASALPPASLSWDQRRDAVLRSDAPPSEKADQLLGMLPDLASADQEEAARHLVNLLGDDRFVRAGAWLTNAQAPAAVQSLLMAELMNRPDKVRLPFYLLIAQTPEHPRAAEALYLLSVHLPDGHGTNWAAWETAVQTRLQEQAEK